MSFEIDEFFRSKKERNKFYLSVIASRMLYLMYSAIKYNEKKAKSYSSFTELVEDVEFVQLSLSRVYGGEVSRSDAGKYKKALFLVEKRGYTGLIDYLELIWNLTSAKQLSWSEQRRFAYNLLGLENASERKLLKVARHIEINYSPFFLRIKDFSIAILEAYRGTRLAKLTLYINGSPDREIDLDLFVRFTLDKENADALIFTQHEKGNYLRLAKMIKLYPFLLRAVRTPYRKIKGEGNLEETLNRLLSAVYVELDELDKILNGEHPANILLTLPSISAGGAICFPLAFEGELKETLGKTSVIKIGDLRIPVYRSYYTLLPVNRFPGDYLFLALAPITYPKKMFIVGTFAPRDIVKRQRNATSVNNIFPSIGSIFKAER